MLLNTLLLAGSSLVQTTVLGATVPSSVNIEKRAPIPTNAGTFLPVPIDLTAFDKLKKRAEDARVLHPISIKAFEELTGRRKRKRDFTSVNGGVDDTSFNVASTMPNLSEMDYSVLDLRNMEKLIYGLPGDGETFYLANMTLNTPEGKKLISMERFEGMTKSVECGEKMKLEFISKEAFEYAVKSWGWVNDDKDNSFLMITNHEGCGDDEQRAPFSVYHAEYDEINYIAKLDARPVKWKDIADTFDLDFGKLKLSPLSTKIARRGFFRRLFRKIKNMKLDTDKKVTIDVTNKVVDPRIFSTSPSEAFALEVDCVDCGIQGQIEFGGHVSVKKFKVKALSFEISPENFEAVLKLGVKVSGKAEGPGATFEKELFSVALGGISIPGIFTLGPTLGFEAGFSTSIEGQAEITYGVKAKLKNSATLKVDFFDKSKSKASGWEPKIERIPFGMSAEAIAGVSAFAQPVLALSFDVLGVLAYEAALKLKLPEVTANLTALSDKSGVCGGDMTTGVRVDTTLGVDMSFRVGEDKTSGAATFFETSLFNIESKPFGNACIGLY